MQILATARRSAPKRSNMELGCARALGHTQRRTASECALVLAHFERVRLRATFTVAVAESRGRCGRPQCLSRGARNAMCSAHRNLYALASLAARSPRKSTRAASLPKRRRFHLSDIVVSYGRRRSTRYFGSSNAGASKEWHIYFMLQVQIIAVLYNTIAQF